MTTGRQFKGFEDYCLIVLARLWIANAKYNMEKERVNRRRDNLELDAFAPALEIAAFFILLFAFDFYCPQLTPHSPRTLLSKLQTTIRTFAKLSGASGSTNKPVDAFEAEV